MTMRGVRREPGQVAAALVAVLFVLAGVLDFGSGVVDNLVHLAFGLVGLVASRAPRAAHAFLIGGGVVYVLLWQFGSVADPSIVPFHTQDVTVHTALVASMIGFAVLSGGRAPAPSAVRPEVERHLASARYVRTRAVPSRPPGRADRRTPAQTAGSRSLSVPTCRV